MSAPNDRQHYYTLLIYRILLSIDNISVDFGGTNLFRDVSFIINKKDRIALVGKNI